MKLSKAVVITLFETELKENCVDWKPQSLDLLTLSLHLWSPFE